MTNCFIFHGNEEFLQSEALKALRGKLGDPGVASMNTTELDGRKLALPDLIAAAEAMPFLGDRRLVLVEGLLGRLEGRGGKVPKADQQFAADLIAYLRRVSPSTWLVLDEDHAVLDTHPVMQFARVHADMIEVQFFGRLGEIDLRKWLSARAKHHGGSLASDALEKLATAGDADLRLLDQEIAKLVTFANGRPVAGGDVERLVHAARNVDVFAMVDALGQRDGRRAIAQFHALVEDGEPPARLLFMITRQFRMIMQAKDLEERKVNPADRMRSLGAASFIVNKVTRQAQQFTRPQLDLIYRRLLEVDQGIKTGQAEPLLAADMLIAEITARSGPRASTKK
ncbi:MAG: DNA polymerase III subunit delta [Chloroflexi bacterium]|nr:DNA polymerase III subunit delta [Chloroflexota bacterium]